MKIFLALMLFFNTSLAFSISYENNDKNSIKELEVIKNDFVSFSKISEETIEAVISTEFKNIIMIKLYAEKMSPRDPVYVKYLVNEKSIVAGDILLNEGYGLKPFDDALLKERTKNYLDAYLLDNDNGSQNVTIDNISENEETTLYVFTDTSCGYCSKYYDEIPALNAAGVSVRHIPYPRSYNPFSNYEQQAPAFTHISNTLCVKDGGKLLSEYFSKTAKNPVIEIDLLTSCIKTSIRGFFLGQNSGVTGTPGTLLEDGSFVSGYIKAPQMIRILKGKKLLK
jgi:hypothetical protein